MSETVRLRLSIAATEDTEIGCLDVKTAFLYGDAPDDQYARSRTTKEVLVWFAACTGHV